MLNFSRFLRYVSQLPVTLGRPLSRAYMPEMDGLRFIALMLVMLWHSSIRAARYSEQNGVTEHLFWYFPHGEIGVLLFFCISGYVVAQPFLNRPHAEWNVKSFYWRRFVRIYPPYFIALSMCFLALRVMGHVPENAKSFNSADISITSSYLASIFYMHGFIFDAPSRLNPPIWSLEIEILFYALAPLLLFFYTVLRSKPVRIASLCATILAIVSFTAIASSQFDMSKSYRWGNLIHSYLFLLGILAADITGNKLSRPRQKRFLVDIVFIIGFAGLLATGLAMTQVDAELPGGLSTFVRQLSIIMFLIFVFAGAFYGKVSSSFLSLPWIRLTGTMCYSIYLTHIVAMQAASEVLGKMFELTSIWLIWTVWLGVLIPAGLVVGLVFYICVERPFANAAIGRQGITLKKEILLP